MASDTTTQQPREREVTHDGRTYTVERSCNTQGWWRITIRDANGSLANRRRDLHEHRLDTVEQQLLDECSTFASREPGVPV